MEKFLWVFKRIPSITGNYHSEAGIAVIAEHENEAKELINNATSTRFDTWLFSEDSYSEYGPEDKPESKGEWVFMHAPDLVVEVSPTTPSRVFIFPDSGCC